MKKSIFIIPFIIAALVFAPTAGFFSPDVMAADTDAAYEKSLSVISALNINENITKEPSSKVCRGEFAALAVRLLNMGSLGYTDYYTDVSEATEFSNEISAAKKLGVAGGVSDTEFAPAASVTYGQAVKMIVCALGLDQPAKVGGGYPFGYMKVANNLDILDDISYSTDLPITYRDAVVLIYNALLSAFIDVEKVAVDDPESILYYKKSDTLVIDRYFNYHIKEGIVWAAGKASMHISAGIDDIIEIDGERFVYEGSDIIDYLGLDVMIIVNKNNKVINIVSTDKNTVHTIMSDDIIELSASKVECFDGDKEKKYSFASDYTMLRNWRASSASQFDLEDARLVIIDNNNDGKFDVVHVQKAETMIISNVSGKNVSDKYSGTTMTMPDEVAVIRGNDSVYVASEELIAGMILSVYLDDSGSISHAVAGYDILHGASVTGKDNEVIYVDGIGYETSAYFKRYFNYNVEIGTRITAYFDSLGKICYMEKYISKDFGGMNYGFLIGIKFDGSFGEVLLNILKADGAVEAFKLKDKITLDGEGSVDCKSDKVKNALTRDGAKVKYTLIKYAKSADGLITKIDTPEVRNSENFAEKYAGTSWQNDNSLTLFVKGAKAMYRGNGSFFPYCIYNSPILFDVPKTLASQPNEDYDEALFSVRTKGFSDNDKVTADFYDYDSGFAPAVMVNYAAAGSGVRPMDVDMNDDPVAVVIDTSRVMNYNGDETIGLTLIEDGKEKKAVISANILPYFEENNLIPKKGDMIQYASDGVGEVAGITLFAYDSDTGMFSIDYSKTGDNILDDTTFIAGKVYSISSSHIAFAASTKPGAFSGVDHPDKYFIFKIKSNAVYVNCNLSEDEFGIGSAADISTIESVGEANASDVIMRLDWGQPILVGIYN